MSNGELPAFVVPKERGLDRNQKNGLTKREYFAAMAMQAMVSRGHEHSGFSEADAKQCLFIADELLKALES